MTEAVKQSTDLLNALDPNKKVGKRDTNNLALSDQIQFSSILRAQRAQIDTPEKMMELAAGPAKPISLDHRGEKPTERETQGAKQASPRRDARRDDDDDTPSSAPRIERPATPETTQAPQHEAASDDKAPEVTTAPTDAATEQAAAIAASTTFRNAVLDTRKIAFNGTSNHIVKPAADKTAPVTSAPTADETEQPTQPVVANTAFDQHLARAGRDAHGIANTPSTTSAAQASDHWGPSSLKDEQAADLSNRLGNVGPVAVHVDVANDATQAKPAQLSGLGAGVDFNKFQGFDVNDPTTAGQPAGDGAGTDQKAVTSHANLPGADGAAGLNPQDIENVFNQAMRAQGAVIGAQQAANQGADGKAQFAQADTIQPVGIAASAGPPTQLSQTTKAAPTAAPRQPEKTQTPAEQIAVKIRQAIGEGADKINIKLNPHELGRVEVRLELAKDGSMTATVLAERQDTLDMLRKDAPGLQRALNDAGLQANAASLSFGLRGDGEKSVDSGRDRRNTSQGRADRTASRIEFGEDAGIPKAGVYGRTLRSDGGVDIKV